MKKIEARNIHKSFQELNVLHGIDLDGKKAKSLPSSSQRQR